MTTGPVSDGIGKLRPSNRLSRAVVAGGLLVGLAFAVAAALAIWAERARALRETGRELQNLSHLLADHSDRALQAVDIANGAVLERASAEGALDGPEAFVAWAVTRDAHEALRKRSDIMPQVHAMLLLDAAGTVLATSRVWPYAPINSGDREYFRTLRDGGPPLVIGPPVRNRGNNAWSVHAARRIEGRDGRFLGVIAGVVEVSYFERLYGGIALGPDSAVTLFRADGLLLARIPPVEGTLGRSFGTTAQFTLTLQHGGGAPVRAEGVDGVLRLVSGRSLASVPVRVHVSLPVEVALTRWRSYALRLGTATLLLLALLSAAVLVALRAIRAEADAAQRRLALQSEVAARHAEFRHAIEGMSQGVWKFGRDGRLGLANRRCCEILGLPAEAVVPGATLPGIEALAGAAEAEGARRLLQALAALVGTREDASFLQDMPEARTVAVLYRPMPDGGWIATFEDVTERHRAEARMRYLARHDSLTGLLNRASLHEALEDALDPAGGAEGGVALLYMDLDRFKQVNDTLGHPVGDILLRSAAGRILRSIRADRAGGDPIARLGGDEFAILLRPAPGGAEDARAAAAAVAARLVAALSEPFMLDGQEVLIGTTIGVALHPEDGATPVELLRAADLALYRAKAEGRGRHRFFERAMDEEARERRAMELDLRRTLEQGGRDLELHFQPIVEIATGRPTACEALVRWRRPGQEGLVGPGVFVPVAEEANLIGPLGELILRRACAEAARWPDRSLRLAVNLSPAQFRGAGLVRTVSGALEAAGLDPRRLELEITEGVLMQGTEEVLAAMHALRALGVRFAMDDFGTGYSSLSYLRSFAFDAVKIDRDFVRDIEARPGDAAIVRAVAELCRELGMTTVAEGVETEGQLRLVAGAGCREAQGYLFGRPVPAERLAGLLAQLGPGLPAHLVAAG